jgi:hypothetical protein
LASCRAAYLVSLSALLWASPGISQTRPEPIPADALRGYVRHVTETNVTVDGKPMRLAAGAIIRDQRNLIIVPVSLPREGAFADFLVNGDGQLFRVWLPTPGELAMPRRRFGG